ncbi:MAG: hypothetical protein ACREQV_25165, partial [Candidatus Binatia bacterium]
TKAYAYFHDNEKEASAILAKYMNLDLQTTLETYRIAKFSFSRNGVLTDKEVEKLLIQDAKTLNLSQPIPASKVFDFSVQKEINKGLGIH